MLNIPNYKINKEIHKSSQSVIYKAERVEDKKPVIIKMMSSLHPTFEEISRFQREFDLTHSLNIEGAIKVFEFGKFENRYFISMEDVDAVSLSNSIEKGSLSIDSFLKIAIKVSSILSEIHSINIMHKDIKPANIIWNNQNDIIKLIDFGISTQLARENSNAKNPKIMEGTIAYMSPEQTGRMNRSIDYRTDFYSLGITFYYLLANKLPFQSEDSMEVVHFHIAKTPASPNSLNPEIPKMLSDIIMKLMSKNAEDRYQTANGLKYDLQQCQKNISEGKLETFPLGEKDFSPKFQLPQKFYGRENEVSILLAAYERASKSNIELVLVAGYSGIGKSSIVNELQKPITERNGFFISGKFDQLKRNTPYSALIQAFRELVKNILTEDDLSLKNWKETILNGVGINGLLLTEIIPELESIIGNQPPLSELPPTEAQNRFSLVFQNFAKSLASKKHPLTIFLDDLQWADSPSLKLLELLILDPEANYLFIIGAYRDNEVDLTHPLTNMIKSLTDQNKIPSKIILKALSLLEVNQYVADTLHASIEKTKELADIVFQKTGANPFFLNQFLLSLYEDKLFSIEENIGWKWDLNSIKQKQTTNNIIELVTAKINKLSKSSIQILKIASCIGNLFELGMLSAILGKTKKETSDNLWEILKEGLIVPTDENYKFISESAENIVYYKFLHDRVQQAAYSCLNDVEKIDTHYEIGKVLLNRNEENIFEIGRAHV